MLWGSVHNHTFRKPLKEVLFLFQIKEFSELAPELADISSQTMRSQQAQVNDLQTRLDALTDEICQFNQQPPVLCKQLEATGFVNLINKLGRAEIRAKLQGCESSLSHS